MAFDIPKRITKGLTESDVLGIFKAAQAVREGVMSGVGPAAEAFALLEDDCDWAAEVITTRAASAKRTLAALRRFEFAELELARHKAVMSPEWSGYSATLDIPVREQMEMPIDISKPGWEHRDHREMICAALNSFHWLDYCVQKEERRHDEAETAIPRSNHSKGRNRGKKLTSVS